VTVRVSDEVDVPVSDDSVEPLSEVSAVLSPVDVDADVDVSELVPVPVVVSVLAPVLVPVAFSVAAAVWLPEECPVASLQLPRRFMYVLDSERLSVLASDCVIDELRDSLFVFAFAVDVEPLSDSALEVASETSEYLSVDVPVVELVPVPVFVVSAVDSSSEVVTRCHSPLPTFAKTSVTYHPCAKSGSSVSRRTVRFSSGRPT
jgi:hypothetical protein